MNELLLTNTVYRTNSLVRTVLELLLKRILQTHKIQTAVSKLICPRVLFIYSVSVFTQIITHNSIKKLGGKPSMTSIQVLI